MKYEPMHNCSHVIGVAPYRTLIGSAYCEKCEEPYVVVWNEASGQRVFIQARYAYYPAAEGLANQTYDWNKSGNLGFLTQYADEPHHPCAAVPA